MFKFKNLSLIVILSLIGTSSAFAQMENEQKNDEGDLSISQAIAVEMMLAPIAKEMFSQSDINADGKLTIEELEKDFSSTDESKENFEAIDTNSDGYIVLEEMMVFMRSQANRLNK